MTIGLNNFLTTLWFILMLSSGSILTYTTWDKIFHSDIIFIAKFFIVIIYILALGTMIFLLIKFRILFVTKDKLTSLYIFRLKKTTILIDEIATSKWTTWDIKAHKFISLTITDKRKNQLSLSDFEFENFDNIVASILGDKNLNKSLTHYKEQAKQNKSLTYFLAITSTALLIFCFRKLEMGDGFNWTHAICFVTIVTILATIKRIIKYRQIEKYGI
jgi:hypothetical protein